MEIINCWLDPSCAEVHGLARLDEGLRFSHAHKMPFLSFFFGLWMLKSLLLMMIQLPGLKWNSRVFTAHCFRQHRKTNSTHRFITFFCVPSRQGDFGESLRDDFYPIALLATHFLSWLNDLVTLTVIVGGASSRDVCSCFSAHRHPDISPAPSLRSTRGNYVDEIY